MANANFNINYTKSLFSCQEHFLNNPKPNLMPNSTPNQNQTKLNAIKTNISHGNTQRLKYIFAGLEMGITADQITELSGIHPWFTHKLASFWTKYQAGEFAYFDNPNGVNYKMVDTCAGEFVAKTPFFYSTKKIDITKSTPPTIVATPLSDDAIRKPDSHQPFQKGNLETTTNYDNEANDGLYNTGETNFDYLIDKAKKDGRELVVDAVVFNQYNKIFVQKRRSDRKFLPNCWGVVGGHFFKALRHSNLNELDQTIFAGLDTIIHKETGWNLGKIRSVLEIRDWEYKGIRKRTVVFDVVATGNLDTPTLQLDKVKGFMWVDEEDLEIFYVNKSYEEELVYKVCKKALDMHNNPKKVIILGSGPIRIGQGVEFDYLTVHAVRALQKKGIKAIIVNNNPETVSTDYSTSDRLYFEPLTASSVANIVHNEKEGLLGVIAQFGGQTAVNLARPLQDKNITILGTNADAIDLSEDRKYTGQIIARLGYKMPEWDITTIKSEILPKAQKLGFPVLIRPSFVMGGDGMRIVYSETEVKQYFTDNFPNTSADFIFDKPMLIDKFLDNAMEVDIDFITDGDKTYCFILEQLDKAGIHSGDSACVFPSQNISRKIMDKLVEITRKVAKEFKVIGIGNLQCAIKDNEVYIIEVNPRASRTVPFLSKCLGFSLTELATNVIMGDKLPEFDFDLEYYKNPEYAWSLRQEVVYKEQPIQHIAPKFVAIKWPVFCLHKLIGVKPELGPLMKSTGEAMTVGRTFEEAKDKWLKKGKDLECVEIIGL